ncbi:LytTR family DNA-binding domain-containing protein [Brevundimonas sp. AAP58]|uniref:LytTR family DNA-binding domain-containing protein n=1 Tax=Brevundimonas sp. AAP58 TaxID=1523422 RepID=UPI0018D1534A|nr:LytTR family DNA-binding domain-containing protein [Brevundimonas sp. AAP58]
MIEPMPPSPLGEIVGRDGSQLGGTAVAPPRRWWKSDSVLAAGLAAYAYSVTVLCAAAYHSAWNPNDAKISFGGAVIWQGVVYGLWVPLGMGLLNALERCRTIRRGLLLLGLTTAPSVALHTVLASWADVAFSPTLEWRNFPALVGARLPIDIAIWTMIAASLFALIWRKRAAAETDQVRRLKVALADTRQTAGDLSSGSSRISVSAGRRKVLVDLKEIERFGSAANYVVVHWQDREGLLREPLKQLEQRLDSRVFMRVHRSSVVNLAHVVDAAPLADGSWRLCMTSGAEVILSRSYREPFLQRVGMRRCDSSTDIASNARTDCRLKRP